MGARYDSLDVESEQDYKALLFWPNKCAFVQSLESVAPCVEDLVREGGCLLGGSVRIFW